MTSLLPSATRSDRWNDLFDYLAGAVERAEMHAEEIRRGWADRDRLNSLEIQANCCSFDGGEDAQ